MLAAWLVVAAHANGARAGTQAMGDTPPPAAPRAPAATQAPGATPRPAAAAPPAAAPATEPATLAVEDTLPVPRLRLKEIEIRARRASLDEILDRIAAGEARRDSMMHDQVYDLYARIIAHYPGREPEQKVLAEQVTRVYRQRPNLRREVMIRQSGSREVHVRAGPDMREGIVNFAFDPRLRKQYRFRILGRDLVGGHVIYRLGFEPRSPFYRLPTGRLWVDTNEFVILREEFWYRGISPQPLVFKSLDDCVVERTRVQDTYWVLSRIAARVTFTLPILGVPPQGDLVISFQNHRINQGIDPAVFGAAASARR